MLTSPARTSFATPHGALQLPSYLPDATQGVVRGVDSADLEACGIDAVVMNCYHLMQKPGSSTVQALGGLHRMAGWQHPIIIDSGGFQAYSLIRQNPKNGSINDKGIMFKPEGAKREYQLSPEKSIQLQMSYGADVVICLDECTNAADAESVQRESVSRTIAWARRCKAEYERLAEQKRLAPEQRPRIFGVIQGGGSRDLRRQCADALLAIGFDGYGFGGWPLDEHGHLLHEIIGYVRELVPAQFVLHALGVGHPGNVAACYRLGYDIFDSSMPTRDARHGRLSVFTAPETDDWDETWFDYLYIADEKHIKSAEPISPNCDCLTCTRYSRGYLHHLHDINDTLYTRLATIHNLRFMAQLMDRLRSDTAG
jgi:queuine tRNA-ribosyltransferase